MMHGQTSIKKKQHWSCLNMTKLVVEPEGKR
jgi:hypothetical protein